MFIFEIILSFIFGIINAFIENIIMFDSFLLALLAGYLCHSIWTIHPAFCLLIGIAVFLLLLLLQRTRFGFWIIGIIMSLFWALVFAVISLAVTGEDEIWFWVVMGLSFVIVGGLHLNARNNY